MIIHVLLSLIIVSLHIHASSASQNTPASTYNPKTASPPLLLLCSDPSWTPFPIGSSASTSQQQRPLAFRQGAWHIGITTSLHAQKITTQWVPYCQIVTGDPTAGNGGVGGSSGAHTVLAEAEEKLVALENARRKVVEDRIQAQKHVEQNSAAFQDDSPHLFDL